MAEPGAPAARPARRLGGAFLGGAGGRLLPASVPLRYFGAAAVFHLLAWLALAAGATGWPQWHGGLGWPLAALHGITAGTLVASAIGASLQLLPVATRQPVRWPRLPAALWWLFTPGTALLMLGMGLAQPALLAAGAAAVSTSLAVWGVLLALNLRGARGMPGVRLHGRGALVALVLLIASALALVALWLGHPVLGRDSARALHAAAGIFGVMGLLVFGLSTILLPMFALAPVPDEQAQLTGGGAGLAALALAAVAAFLPHPGAAAIGLRLAAVLAAAAALAVHVRLMQRVLASGMRGDLGRTGRLLKVGWASAALAIVLAIVTLALDALGRDSRVAGELFVLAAVGGWLLSFLFAVLQRMLPFLAAMHASRGRKRPPTPSALTLEPPLAWHLRCHVVALVLLAAAMVVRSPPLLLAAAAVGSAGAVAFIVFVATLMRRLAASAVAAAPSPADAAWRRS